MTSMFQCKGQLVLTFSCDVILKIHWHWQDAAEGTVCEHCETVSPTA